MTPQELRIQRRILGLTQAQLGAALGVAPNTIARWEHGTRSPENPTILELALTHLRDCTAHDGRHPPR